MNLDALILSELQRGGPPLWVSGRTYPVGVEVRSPANSQRYVRIKAGAGASDPAADEVNWIRWSKGIDDAIAAVAASVGNVQSGISGVASTMAKGADLSAVGALLTSVSAAVSQIAAKLDALKATVDGSGIKNVQRGMFAGVQVGGGAGYYDMVISAVNPARSRLALLTTEWPGYGGNQSIALRSDGAAIRVFPSSGGQNYTNFPPFSWEVIEWLR
ncbi:hypothetical protein C8245_13955 [Paracidovorax avenae]|uniref:hypothetical protein n=1 Tax=Paracidovorax avenae TaxID=80867 RepID=UPI000D209C7D|nr:hypothetical protein [Paracidovorax avenae]AVS66637.1 hypothetical protein C8245_13955 [Paracidovorax avenae]